MNLRFILRVALRSLRRAVLRSALTMLGIVIGVATVIAMVGIGTGAKDKVSNLLSAANSNRLYLYAYPPQTDWRNGITRLRPGDGIRLSDYEAIRTKVPGVASIGLEVWPSVTQVIANGRTSRPNVEGVNLEDFALLNRQIVSGTMFGRSDERAAASVCLITQSLAHDLFEGSDPIGRVVRLNRTPFLVIGIVQDDNTRRTGRGDAKDLAVFVPYTSVLARMDAHAQIYLGITATNPALLHDVQRGVSDLMEENRGTRRAEFLSSDISQMISSYTSGVETMTLLLASIAGISLLVGGIGIMNIMLVSVTERTREIGIRLAIGTRERDILRQFLFEAAILSISGGTLGICLGLGAAQVMSRFYSWTTHVTVGSVVGAFVTSALIGIFFGWYPAKKAARLDPIEALRYE